MHDHSYSIERGEGTVEVTPAPVFNVAVPFIDRHLGEGRADKDAIRHAGGAVTYKKLAERVNRAGNALLAMGLKPGNRLLMIVLDGPAFYYLFWGAIKAGIVPAPLNTLLRAGDYQHMIDDSGCAGLVYSSVFADEVGAATAAASHKPGTVTLVQEFMGRLSRASDDLAVHLSAPEDDCFWLYSSGSTGRPKGAVHAHQDMLVTGATYADMALGMREDDICFSAAKLFFAYGLGNGMSFPLWAGATAVLAADRSSPQMTFEVIETFKPTLYFGVPTLYAAQLLALETETPDLSSVRLCVSAGEALPADIFKRWREKTGLTILDGIGSTEALHIFISNLPGDIKPGTSGRVVPGYDAKIIDEDGATVAVGDSGQLLIRGGSTARYYWNNPEKTAQTMVDGWLDTGDTYIQDDDGYFHYCGRNDDMLKVGGIWCSPFEIEAKLVEHPKVLEAAVIGREDSETLIKPMAFIVLNDAGDASKDLEGEFHQLCKAGLTPYKYPRWYRFVAELPKTAIGKIQRFRLRQQIASA